MPDCISHARDTNETPRSATAISSVSSRYQTGVAEELLDPHCPTCGREQFSHTRLEWGALAEVNHMEQEREHVVLIVEDNPDLRKILSMIIEELGCRVVTACNGSQGLQKLQALANPPCVVLLDLMMPVMNGWRFLEEIEKDSDLAGVPVVVLSAIADECGPHPMVSKYLAKPVTVDQLIPVLEQYC